ncbi:bacteriophage protein [Amycolatopsis acidiphila]|uniref:AAA family ATPase n=2 Tax=Amycolatopsis acidiphila TaxID=715473 RepID=A0A558A124_9PSEU|nr:AAA family ATPase [Amycolatopsis acidiphila]GHG71380.1 bacteriophage protein [Amycolatopsis acidiphila]
MGMALERCMEPVRTAAGLEADWNTERNSEKGWPQFLESVSIDGLRGWRGEEIEFRFPVVAIAGVNGSGKSTVLKAAATAYRAKKTTSKHLKSVTFNPDDFFPSTPWENVNGVVLEHRFRLGGEVRTVRIRKRTERWRGMPSRAERVLFFLDISRIQPIDTLIGYGKLAKSAAFSGDGMLELSDEFRALLSRVLGISFSSGKVLSQGEKQVGVLERNNMTYSNYHQGAGEDTTADLVAMLQELPRNSLVVIDEVEASLHPRAQRRLMAELLDVARRKRLQFILSTHSPYIFEQLPQTARIFIHLDRSYGRQVIYGVTPEFALSLMDDVGHPELTLYCEDAESVFLVDRIVSYEDFNSTLAKRIRMVSVGPASTVKAIGRVAAEGKLPGKGLGVLDGDQDLAEGCIKIPGSKSPEATLFQSFTSAQWASVAELLGVRPGDLEDAVEDAMRLENVHTWCRRTAERLGPRVRAQRVWEDAVSVWVDQILPDADRKAFVEEIRSRLG